MTSCGGMFSVIVRRSTFTIWSTNGISKTRPGPFGWREQPAEAEDDAALVLARNLDRRDEEEDDEEDDDREDARRPRSRRQPTPRPSRRARDLPLQQRDVRARHELPAVCAVRLPELAVRRRPGPETAPRPLRRRSRAGLTDGGRRRTPRPFLSANTQNEPRTSVTATTIGTDVWYGAGALWNSITMPNPSATRPATVSAPCVTRARRSRAARRRAAISAIPPTSSGAPRSRTAR